MSRKLKSIVGLILGVAFLVSFIPTVFASPSQVHLTWSREDTAHTMTVTWWTPSENEGDKVLYDTMSRNGKVSRYTRSATGSHHTFSGFNGYIHDVELTGLSPDTTYYFICGGEEGGYSQEWSFVTAPTGETDVKFVGGGDSRAPHSGEDSKTPFPEARDLISLQMSLKDPAFALYSGDFVLGWDNQSQWRSWFEAMQGLWVTDSNRMIPIIPCVGNHEIKKSAEANKNNGRYYYEQFSLPGNERWYSLDWGSSIHIVVLNSEVPPEDLSGEQREWLFQDLSSHQDYEWTIAMFHRPPFSAGMRHKSYRPIKDSWLDIMENFGVDFVINGHSHNYQRTKPINYSKQDGPNVFSSLDEGIVYLVSGGWGAPVYPTKNSDLVAKVSENNNFILFNNSASENKMNIEVFDRRGNLIESIPYSKDSQEESSDFHIPVYVFGVVAGFIVILIIFYLTKK